MIQDTTQIAGQKRKNKATASTVDSSLELPSGDDNPQAGTPKKKKSAKPKKPLDSRFGGKTEEELMELLLPDHLKPNLDIVFIGINPGLLSAYLGHHYCNANNHFWPCMYESGLVPRRMTYKEDAECLDHGIGFTNIVPRTTRSSNDLTRKEIKEWSAVMIERMKELKPLIACFNGKGIYEIFLGKKCEVGLQPVPLPDTKTAVYVMPSTSGRAASHPRRVDKLKFFHELKQLRDNLLAKHGRIRATPSDTSSPLTQESNSSSLSHPTPSMAADPLVTPTTGSMNTTVTTPTPIPVVPLSSVAVHNPVLVPIATLSNSGAVGSLPCPTPGSLPHPSLCPNPVPLSCPTPVIVLPHCSPQKQQRTE